MIEVVQDLKLISAFQKIFISRINKSCSEKINSNIGWKGGSRSCQISYSPEMKFWVFSEVNWDNKKKPKYLNAFSSGKPVNDSNVSAQCQVNFPKGVSNNRLSGRFAIDENHRVCVLHSGKIFNKTKESFFNEYKGESLNALENNISKRFAIITTLDSPNLVREVKDFISEIERLKL